LSEFLAILWGEPNRQKILFLPILEILFDPPDIRVNRPEDSELIISFRLSNDWGLTLEFVKKQTLLPTIAKSHQKRGEIPASKLKATNHEWNNSVPSDSAV
jgi:hypothetical protein